MLADTGALSPRWRGSSEESSGGLVRRIGAENAEDSHNLRNLRIRDSRSWPYVRSFTGRRLRLAGLPVIKRVVDRAAVSATTSSVS